MKKINALIILALICFSCGNSDQDVQEVIAS